MKISEQNKTRFKAIEYLVLWEGGVNASRLSRLFGVQANVIVKSISDYRSLYPGQLLYDAKDPEKLYVANDCFTPTYISHFWSAYINFINTFGNKHITHLYGHGTLSDLITPLCNPKPNVTSVLLKAIRQKRAVRIDYKSMNNPQGLRRNIIPTALSHDGIRWHCRAFCCLRHRFSDFNLGRMENLVLEEKKTLACEDNDWLTFVDIIIDGHPELDDDERALVLSDYGYDDVFTLRTRGALLDYTIQYYRLGRDPKNCPPDRYPLIIKNMEALEPYLFGKST